MMIRTKKLRKCDDLQRQRQLQGAGAGATCLALTSTSVGLKQSVPGLFVLPAKLLSVYVHSSQQRDPTRSGFKTRCAISGQRRDTDNAPSVLIRGFLTPYATGGASAPQPLSPSPVLAPCAPNSATG